MKCDETSNDDDDVVDDDDDDDRHHHHESVQALTDERNVRVYAALRDRNKCRILIVTM
jgi:hypothetical protein